MSSTIHPLAHSGFAPSTPYDTHRPSYPSPAVSSLLSALHLEGVQGAHIVELGAGTGKFTELLARREEGFRIVAGEPHAGMRGVLVGKKLGEDAGAEGRVRVLKARAESMGDVADRWAGGVVVAQAFHWFANIDTLREIRRMLGSNGGGLGMVWNVDDFNAPTHHPPSTPHEARLKAIIRSLPHPTNLYRDLKWKDVFLPEQQQLFEWPLKEEELAYETRLSREQIWDRFATMSQVASLDGAELQAMRERVFEALGGDDVEEDGEGKIRWHGRTVWYWTFPSAGSSRRC